MLRILNDEVAYVALTHYEFSAAWRCRAESFGLRESGSGRQSDRRICGRELVRALLELVEEDPAEVSLYANTAGRLVLDTERWYASISHSAPFCVAAIAEVPVGIDIERRDRQRDWKAIVESMFSEAATSRLWSAPAARHPEAFLEEWTRAEACAKIRGGLILPLSDDTMTGRHRSFRTEELIGCVVTTDVPIDQPETACHA